ncbi:hypothetical protein [uncultured Pseudoalteromonas sp.]|uniref:DUF7674 family protein n=1 Tax=uncultured Pseudoalteromonas sp. TaxID=114053 RepID=UPI0030C8776A
MKTIFNLLDEIITQFPEVNAFMSVYDEDETSFKMEAFSKATTHAFALGNEEQAVRYLNYMAEKLINAEAKVIEHIDVYYVETLFWGASPHTIALGWPLVPESLQTLYIRFHGKAPLN